MTRFPIWAVALSAPLTALAPSAGHAEVLECLFKGSCVAERQTCYESHMWSVRLHVDGPPSAVIQHRKRRGNTFGAFYPTLLPADVTNGDFVTSVVRVNGAGQADVYSIYRDTGQAIFMRSSLSRDSDVSSLYTGNCKKVPG